MGRLERIWIKRFHKGPMDPHETATLVAGVGIEGNADQGGTRQVTLLDQQRWSELMARTSGRLDPRTRRANLLVSGLPLDRSRGRVLRIGVCLLRVAGETRPCEQMEQAQAGLQSAMALDWSGGVFAEVVAGGMIHQGDTVTWVDAPSDGSASA